MKIHKFKSNLTKNILFSLIIFTTFTIQIPQVIAVVPVPFGGLETSMIPCTCPSPPNPGTQIWHFFSPLYLGLVPIVGGLVAPVTPLAFPAYYLKPGSWALGMFSPGVSSLTCGVGVGLYCVPLPNLGLILPNTGTSLTI